VELTSIVDLTLIVTGVSFHPSVSVLDGHDLVLNSGNSAEDSLDCDSEMGVDEWSGMGNYNKEKQLLFKYCTKF
jgi:hypothetical protein